MALVTRARFTPEERKRILRTVFLDRSDRWVARFATMMALSATIASLGMMANSPAIVIGAMLIAPLMTPLQALSVAVAMGWARRVVVPLATVVAAVAGSIALAWALAALVPQATTVVLPEEVLARTSPDLLDLFVALAAGAAGAYATAREDISAAIPGVAVAVALVPPLSAIGIAAEAGESSLAYGALILFTTNLVAILLASIVVLFATGFVPLPHLRRVRGRILVGVVPVVVATVLISVPLASALNRTVASANELERVTRAITNWLGPETSLEVDGVSLRDAAVTVDLAGPQGPPSVEGLLVALQGILGDDASAEVTWSLRQNADVATGGGSVDRADAQLVRQVAEEWLAASGAPGSEVEAVSVGSDQLTVGVASPSEPPPALELADLLEDRLGQRPERLEVLWTQRRLYRAGADGLGRDVTAAVELAVQDWVQSHEGLRLVEVEVGSELATVTVSGARAPAGIEELQARLAGLDGFDADLEVRFRFEEILTGDAGQGPTDPGLLDAEAVRQAVEAWLARVPSLGLTGVTTTTDQVDVQVAGPDRPAPAALLAEAIGVAAASDVRVIVTWSPPQGDPIIDQARWFPSVELATIPASRLFAYGSSLLDAAAIAELGEMMATLTATLDRSPASVVRIASHTDAPGTEELNLDLSRQRGRAVGDWLVDRLGLDPGRLVVAAYGEALPVASNDTPAGREANRRLEIHVGG